MEILIPLILLNFAGIYFSDKAKIGQSIGYTVLLIGSLNALYFASLINLLLPVAILVFIFLFGMSVISIFKILTGQIRAKFDVFLFLNNITAFIFTIIFKIQKPFLYYIDEIRIWGPAAKAVKHFNRIYSIGVNPIPADRNYPVGNAILNYFFSFFSKDFSEVFLLLSYAFLYFAAFSVTAAVIYKRTKSYNIAIISYFIFLILPFTTRYHSYSVDYGNILYAYGTSMVDLNLSIVFIMIIALYFYSRKSKWYLLPLIFIVTIKKNGIFLALLAFCIIACYELFSFGKKNWSFKNAISTCLITLAVPLIVISTWKLHLKVFEPNLNHDLNTYNLTEAADSVKENAISNESSDENKAVLPSETSILALFNPKLRTERYKAILAEMKNYFLYNKETIFMRDIFLIIVLTIIGIIASFKQSKSLRIPSFLVTIGLTAGCFVYNLVIAYQMQFYRDMMIEYPRYMLSYYFSWIFIAVIIFSTSKHLSLKFKKLLLCAILIFSVNDMYKMGLDYTVINSPENVYIYQKNVEMQAEKIKSVVNKDEKIFIVFEDGKDTDYYSYRYRLLPIHSGYDTKNSGIDFSINFRKKLDYENGRTYFNVADGKTFTNVMRDYFDYIYIISADRDFVLDYGNLFSDGISFNSLYKITDEKIPMQAVAI